MSLQREFLILPFLLASLLVFPLNNLSGKPWLVIVSGILFLDLAAIIKPQAGLLFIVLVCVILFSSIERKAEISKMWHFHSWLWIAFPGVHGLSGVNQALPAFIETATRYWPLYTAINGGLEINTRANPLLGVLEGMKSFGLSCPVVGTGRVWILHNYLQTTPKTWANRLKVSNNGRRGTSPA